MSMILPLVLALSPIAVRAVALINSTDYNSGALGGGPVQTFKSVNFTAAEWNWNVYPDDIDSLPEGLIFLAPRGTDVDVPTAIIYDINGEVVWHGKDFGIGQSMSFCMGTYQGQDVLALWAGTFNANGYGDGYGLILDQTYTVIANVTSAIDGSGLDLHEFALTDNDTALATTYINEEYDLSSWNVTTTDGSEGWILNGAFQEIDIATGEALFTWKSLDHVDPADCYADPGTTGVSTDEPWDFFHINSIEKDADGNYLVSSRHCHTLYQIDASTGEILWTMGGTNSSFTMGDNTGFEWQHHARWMNNYTQISLFDNAATDWESDEDMASGKLLNVDTSNMTITLAQLFSPWNETYSVSQGSIQNQTNGNYLIGWGHVPFISEYTSDGDLLYSFQIGANSVQNYRALRYSWTAYPTTTPALIAISNSSTSAYDIYTSWNGATEISQWILYGLDSVATDANVTELSSTNKTTFETSFSLDTDQASTYPYIQVQAVASNGTVLGVSDYLSLDSNTTVAATSAVATETATATSSSSTSTSSSTSSSSGAEQIGAGLGLMGMFSAAVLLLI